MKIRTLRGRRVIAIGLAVLLLGVAAIPQFTVRSAPVTPPLPTDPVTEWNQNAVALTLLPASSQRSSAPAAFFLCLDERSLQCSH